MGFCWKHGVSGAMYYILCEKGWPIYFRRNTLNVRVQFTYASMSFGLRRRSRRPPKWAWRSNLLLAWCEMAPINLSIQSVENIGWQRFCCVIILLLISLLYKNELELDELKFMLGWSVGSTISIRRRYYDHKGELNCVCFSATWWNATRNHPI